MLIPYFSDWRGRAFVCSGCGGSSAGSDLDVEPRDELMELRCPEVECDQLVAVIPYPEEAEVRAGAASGDAEAEAEQMLLARGLSVESGATSIIRRTYVIQTWRNWDHEVNGFAVDFRNRFGMFPNVLLANEVTFNRVDMAAAKENIVGDEGQHPGEAEYVSLEGFNGQGYSLTFALDEKLPDLHVSLIYDADPDGDGEPVPEDDTDLDSRGLAAGSDH